MCELPPYPVAESASLVGRWQSDGDKKGSSRITGAWALGCQAGHSSAPLTSHLSPRTWLACGCAGSASPSLSTLGRLARRPWCPPSLLRQSSAFVTEGRSAAMFLLAYGRSTCAELASRVDTKVSHDDTVSWKASRWGGCGHR